MTTEPTGPDFTATPPTGTQPMGTHGSDPHPTERHPTGPQQGGAPLPEHGSGWPNLTLPAAAGITREPAATAVSPTPTRRLNPTGLVIGLACLIVGVLLIAREQFQWKIDWQLHGPVVLIGAGILLVVLGALGLVRRDRRLGTVSHPNR